MPYDEETETFTCELCGATGIASWPYVHCWKCGNREDRPDLGIDAKGQPVQTQGAVFGGSTPDGDTTTRVPETQAGGQAYTPGAENLPPGPPPGF